MSAPNLVKEPEGAGASIAGAIAFACWIGGIAWAWGIPLRTDAGQINGVWTVLLILLLARFGWVIICGFFDRRTAKERGSAGPAEPGDEGGAAGSRLGTLLPLFRSFLLITICVIVVMIVLSKIGVDIAPLFAGAGLVGMAIGFGSQSLVKDIFSGLFFLVDDAFRIGEYIETGGLRGTVEKISIRSMQLRHHTGPLHTIPFGEVTQLTNFSRDWVIMKLPLRVTFDTDPEKVRKLIKKLGQELLDDPLIGDKFVEPLKSQGVREIDDSGQVIRVKFMTRPGDQFVLRKTIYARIRDLFEREGIEFARKEVRVLVSELDHPLSDKKLKEIAGAAAEGALEPPTPSDPTSR
jgi:small-conductance mechanosensitive channel